MKNLLIATFMALFLVACETGNTSGKTAYQMVSEGIASGWPTTGKSNCRRSSDVWYWRGLGNASSTAELEAFYAQNGLTRGSKSILNVIEKMWAGGNLSDADKRDLSCIVTVVDNIG